MSNINDKINEFLQSNNDVFTEEELETVRDNLRAYVNNFDYLTITTDGLGSFNVYTSKERYEAGSTTQFCYNIDYLNGWLYGAVQAVNKQMTPVSIEQFEKNLGL